MIVGMTIAGLVEWHLDALAPGEVQVGWIGLRLGEGELADVVVERLWVGMELDPVTIEALVVVRSDLAWVKVRLERARRAGLIAVLTLAAERKRARPPAPVAAESAPVQSTADEVLRCELELARGRCPLRALRMVHAAARRLNRRGQLTDVRAACVKAEVTAIKARMRAGAN